jgi:hypothetical protein
MGRIGAGSVVATVANIHPVWYRPKVYLVGNSMAPIHFSPVKKPTIAIFCKVLPLPAFIWISRGLHYPKRLL